MLTRLMCIASVLPMCGLCSSSPESPYKYQPTIAWGACPDYIVAQDGTAQNTPQCALVDLPVDYEDQGDKKVQVFVYRYPGKSSTSRLGQVWFLEGGPGRSGANFAQTLLRLSVDYPQWDYYSLDHRGVGNSTRMDCATEGGFANTAVCAAAVRAAWGEDIAAFSTTNAAADLGVLIESIRGDSTQQVFVYGLSYGTYWAGRYLQLFSSQATGVILDSLCPPGVCRLDVYDQAFNDTGKVLLAECGVETICNEKLQTVAGDPWSSLGEVTAEFEAGHCAPLAEQLYPRELRNLMGQLEKDTFARRLIPAIIYRLHRCLPADITALSNLIGQVMPSDDPLAFPYAQFVAQENLSSLALGATVILSEMWGHSVYETLASAVQGYYVSEDSGPAVASIAKSAWPTYGEDGYMPTFFIDGSWTTPHPDTAVPVLMMNGVLDPQTPLFFAEAAAQVLKQAGQQLVVVPHVSHNIMEQSATAASLAGSAPTCGALMLLSFLDHPSQGADTSCLTDILPLDFSGTDEVSQTISAIYMGTPDMWEGDPDAPAGARLMNPALARAIRDHLAALRH